MTENKDYDKDLVSILAHDLRTPISSAKNFIDLAQHSGPLTDKQVMMIERAMKALERMEMLVNDVLEMSRVDQDAPVGREPVDMNLLIRECASLMEGIAAADGITLHLDIQDELAVLHGEQERLQQAVNNLVANGVKYNESGGNVWIKANSNKEALRLVVRDDGLGIPEEDLEHIFDRFYRSRMGKERRIDGTGLGLAIVKAVIEKHGGTIEVESVLEQGTTFTVNLPIVSE